MHSSNPLPGGRDALAILSSRFAHGDVALLSVLRAEGIVAQRLVPIGSSFQRADVFNTNMSKQLCGRREVPKHGGHRDAARLGDLVD